MAIDFPNSPLQGNTYDYLGVRYTYVDTGGGTGFWKVNTPGSVGAASAVEVDSGVVQTKYITPFAMEGSKFKEALDNTGTSASRDIGSAAGDVAEVGEFGIGVGQNGINIDADTRTTPSKERWSTGSTNTPSDGNTFLVDITCGSSTGSPNQLIKQLATGPYLKLSYERVSTDSGATWSTWERVYTKAWFNPLDFDGVGHVLVAKNQSGSAVGGGSTVDGTLLELARWNNSGTISADGYVLSGTWTNKGSYVWDNGYSTFQKVSV
jgi:hypothetical protein